MEVSHTRVNDVSEKLGHLLEYSIHEDESCQELGGLQNAMIINLDNVEDV